MDNNVAFLVCDLYLYLCCSLDCLCIDDGWMILFCLFFASFGLIFLYFVGESINIFKCLYSDWSFRRFVDVYWLNQWWWWQAGIAVAAVARFYFCWWLIVCLEMLECTCVIVASVDGVVLFCLLCCVVVVVVVVVILIICYMVYDSGIAYYDDVMGLLSNVD